MSEHGPMEQWEPMWREHRPVSGVEADPQNGKFHGMCIRCIREWPCEYSPESAFAREQDAARAAMQARIAELEAALRQVARTAPLARDPILSAETLQAALQDVTDAAIAALAPKEAQQ